MTKHCPRCKLTIPLDLFYISRGKPSSYCKKCVKVKQQEWATVNKQRRLELNKAWASRNRERKQISQRASNIIYKAIAKGLITRLDACEACGKTATIEAAHHDYSQPLNVKWLCQSCHRAWDSLNPKTHASGGT